MRNVFIAILIGLILYSCTDKNNVDLRKEIFEFVLKDRIKLNSTINILQESNDSIRIYNLTLIENSFSDIPLDTVNNSVTIFNNSLSLPSSFIKDSISFIANQLKSLKSTSWDTTSLNIDIKIDSPLKELADSIKNRTDLWIANNVKNKAFLQISEPVYNIKGEVMVSARVIVKDYINDKSYILSKENSLWQIAKYSTIVLKQSEPHIKEIIKPDGTKVIENTRYMIVVGYFDI